MKINNTTKKASEHFTHRELFTKSKDFAGKSHDLSDTTIKGLEFIRNYYGVPLIPTSTYRTPAGNMEAGGRSQSQHLLSNAIDFQAEHDRYSFARKFKADYLAPGSELKGNLDFIGVHGVFFYDTFVHIDSRTVPAVADYSTVKSKIGMLALLVLIFLLIY